MSLNNLTLIFDRKLINNKPELISIMMIKHEDAESYADYWYKEESQYSEPEDAISYLDKLLRSIK